MSNKLTILLGCLLILASCDTAVETTYNSQAEKIEAYVTNAIEANPEYRVVYNDGVVRLVTFEGEGAEVSPKGKVSFHYASYNFSSGQINEKQFLSTNISGLAGSAGLDTEDETAFEAVTESLKDKDLIEGLRLGLAGVRRGEDCLIMFTGKKAFGKKQVGMITANTAMAYRIMVDDIED